MHHLSRETLNKNSSLPPYYGEDTLVLLARDPYWLYAYWELTATKINSLKAGLGAGEFAKATKTLKLIKFDHQGQAMAGFDIPLTETADSWYINGGEADRTYQVMLGYMTPEGEFFPLLSSNKSHTPRDSVSSVIDPRWGYLNFWQQRLFTRRLKFNLNSASLVRHKAKAAEREKIKL